MINVEKISSNEQNEIITLKMSMPLFMWRVIDYYRRTIDSNRLVDDGMLTVRSEMVHRCKINTKFELKDDFYLGDGNALPVGIISEIADELNIYAEKYNSSSDKIFKDIIVNTMVLILPMCYIMTNTITLKEANLKEIYYGMYNREGCWKELGNKLVPYIDSVF